jgi:hypothetical protein
MNSKYGNSNDEQVIVGYALRESYESLFRDMLEAVASNNCLAKADAHIALCVKFALANGCDESQVYNCYKVEVNETTYSDFYLFRDHTRSFTDFLDEELDWDMQMSSITDQLVQVAVGKFIQLASEYEFKEIDDAVSKM